MEYTQPIIEVSRYPVAPSGPWKPEPGYRRLAMGAGEIALVAAMLACRPDQFAAFSKSLSRMGRRSFLGLGAAAGGVILATINPRIAQAYDFARREQFRFDIFDMTKQTRLEAGVEPLTMGWDFIIEANTRAKSQLIDPKAPLDHGVNNSAAQTLLRENGKLRVLYPGENLARANEQEFAALGRTLTPASIHRALVRSEDHYSNIVRAGWRELAVGVDMTDNPDGTPAWIAIAEIFQ